MCRYTVVSFDGITIVNFIHRIRLDNVSSLLGWRCRVRYLPDPAKAWRQCLQLFVCPLIELNYENLGETRVGWEFR
jgi:hypothetical protein